MSQSSPEYWEERATTLSRTSLETIRASATAWAATTTTLLSVFGTVSILAAPDTLDGLEPGVRTLVLVLIIGASAAGFASVLLTSWASRGPTKRYAPLTGLRLAAWHSAEAGAARTRLLWGRITGIAAAALVLGTGVVAVAGAKPADADPGPASYLVRTEQGAVQCGTLARAENRLELVGPDRKPLLSLDRDVAEITAVAKCPATP